METKAQQRIFKRIEQASSTQQDINGLGLGLYINQQIIDQHKGEILLESELEVGSTFTIVLPKISKS